MAGIKIEVDKRLLICGATIVTMNRSRDVLVDQDILVVGSRIEAIGKLDDIADKVDEVIQAEGQFLIPGLIQTHTHLTRTLFRNLVADKNLDQWLDEILRLEAAHDRDSNYWSGMLGIAELFLGGTTAIYDMESVHYTDSAFEAIAQTGIRAFSGKKMTDRMSPGGNDPNDLVEPTYIAFEESLKLFEKWEGRDGGRIRYCFCPASSLACTMKLLKLTADFSYKYNARVHIHAAETKEEQTIIMKQTGMRVIDYLDSVGLVSPRTVLAHCVHVNDQEIKIIAKRGAHAAHCPTANLYLASGIAPIPNMMEHGVNIGVGADNAADHTNMDAFQEMKLAALVQKGLHINPTIQPSAQKAFEMATLGGARSLGLEKEIGSIEVGKKADLAILDLRKPHTWPNESQVNTEQSIYARIVYSAKSSDVVLTMVNGRIVMKDGQLLTMDINEVMRKSNESITRLLQCTAFAR
ncbi:amidohydrolase family protein [Paenibacillus sp. PL91]|uniref:amidohydrolase family protein n=1 Tax=Paenibacillus sp. PL91 TaxID=2729538 RepID=UPI00145E0E65|nr:amidohydrolase family protein [Paenibacillus sp. PL91]MBC9201620.1 amidohydrolase family protein [Paenibacillus sp. PL91]